MQPRRSSIRRCHRPIWISVRRWAGPRTGVNRTRYRRRVRTGGPSLARGKNATAAADFLAFFTNPANSVKLAQYFPPPRQTQLDENQPAAQA